MDLDHMEYLAEPEEALEPAEAGGSTSIIRVEQVASARWKSASPTMAVGIRLMDGHTARSNVPSQVTLMVLQLQFMDTRR